MPDQEAIIRLAKKCVRYQERANFEITVTRNIVYSKKETSELALDLYRPAGTSVTKDLPVVVHVTGYPFSAELRSQWMPLISWARLLAGRGVASVIYDSSAPVEDGHVLVDFLAREAGRLGLDAGRCCLMASSGHGPTALALLMAGTLPCKGAVLNYPFLMDIDGHDDVARAAADYGFADACAGRLIDELPRATRLLVTRAGKDQFPGLLESTDRFVRRAREAGLAVELAWHESGGHGFDMEEDSPASREVIKRILDFISG